MKKNLCWECTSLLGAIQDDVYTAVPVPTMTGTSFNNSIIHQLFFVIHYLLIVMHRDCLMYSSEFITQFHIIRIKLSDKILLIFTLCHEFT